MKANEPQPAIIVKNLTKAFRIPRDKSQSVKNKVLGKAGKGYREFTPLDGVSFTINKGDFFAIVGRNGSGKSTLLKTIAGIYEPTAGKVTVDGVLVPFIELGVGFNPQLTGRENVYLNAALLGFSRKETDEMYEDIVDFAELHDFMEERLQNYSSGMQVRLAFSISIRAKGDILLLDEVLAVGDAAFQEKCFKYFEQLKREKKTVILVTHSMANVDRFCNRGLLLDGGKVAFMGSSQELADRYRELFVIKQNRPSQQKANSAVIDGAILEEIALSQHGKSTEKIAADEDFTIKAKVRLKSEYHFCTTVLRINDSQEKTVLAVDTATEPEDFFRPTVERSATISFSIKNFYANGQYSINLQIKASDSDEKRVVLFDRQNVARFEVVGRKSSVRSLFYSPVEISCDN